MKNRSTRILAYATAILALSGSRCNGGGAQSVLPSLITPIFASPAAPGACFAEAGAITTLIGSCSSPAPSQSPSASQGQNVGGCSNPPVYPEPGYSPTDLQCAYNLSTLSASSGSGRTVAIMAIGDTPELEANLGVYRAMYNLPACTTANGCFQKIASNGSTNLPSASSGESEFVIDAEMISAICPLCHITVVEGASTASIYSALQNTVPKIPGIAAVSISLGWTQEPALAQAFSLQGIPIAAASGDKGYGGGISSPASYSTVIAVGGTTLQRDGSTRGWSESAWSDSGSGCSDEPKPTWQTDTGCPTNRTVADVSFVGDPSTGMAFYHLGQGDTTGWGIVGGTSISAPGIAAIYALVGRAVSDASDLYANPSALYDITGGSTGTCAPAILCNAGPGYDGPTGMGTPDGAAASFITTF